MEDLELVNVEIELTPESRRIIDNFIALAKTCQEPYRSQIIASATDFLRHVRVRYTLKCTMSELVAKV